MTEEPNKADEAGDTASERFIPFKQYLETVPPSVEKLVSGAWVRFKRDDRPEMLMVTPDLRLHCLRCDGERTFRSEEAILFEQSVNWRVVDLRRVIDYLCSDCREQSKSFALSISPLVGPPSDGLEDLPEGAGVACKYGE
jgi:hypothetical protein